MKVEVFITNVEDTLHAKKLLTLLNRCFPACKINFDLEDCDKILRIEGSDFIPKRVIKLLNEHGFYCSVLD